VKFLVVDALNLESRGELVVVFRQRPTAEYMDLGLDGDGRALRQAINLDSLVFGQQGVGSVGEATGRLFRIEAG
jgi:hypothetical protein